MKEADSPLFWKMFREGMERDDAGTLGSGFERVVLRPGTRETRPRFELLAMRCMLVRIAAAALHALLFSRKQIKKKRVGRPKCKRRAWGM